MYSNDTIIAQATPSGRGGISILRISGPKVIQIANIILGKLPNIRYADYLPFYDSDGKILDQGIAIYFPAPNSFTGEDVLELQGHGSPIIIDLLFKRILNISEIRIANPGEFSKRAFLNNKIDLMQAEAIADLIDASTEKAARSAINSLQGVFSKKIYKIIQELTNIRVHIEASIDFPDEEVNFLSDNKIKIKLNKLMTDLKNILLNANQGILLKEGIKVVIIGKPNAGKSSLLNALSGREVAIVTDIAGTTRDILHEYIDIDGIPLHIIDTAGLHKSLDKIEQIGIKKALEEIEQADHILFIVDSITTEEIEPKLLCPEFITRLPKYSPITIIRNKVDITNEPVSITKINNYSLIRLSAYRKSGIDLLRQHLKESIRFNYNIEGEFLARRRHIQALNIADKHLQRGYQHLVVTRSCELLAEELRLTQKVLGEITGEFSSDDLLNRIFSSFCIGK
ncbi:MAG: tRNA uridine-5-carboxymethylaminomethyl(34) synthesis GTPase MnmE [Arsenophonus endosymbiont of Ceratovacuna japonica]